MSDALSGFQLAVSHYRQGRLEAAEAQCRQALAQQPRNVPGLHLLGVIQLRRGRPGEALATFDRLLGLHANQPDVLNNRGNALRDLGRPKEALASYDAALRLKPDWADALGNRGNLLYSSRRFVEAAQTYARLRTISPDRPYIHGTLLASRLMSCDWTDFSELSAAVERAIERGELADDPLSITWHTRSAALQLKALETYAQHEFGNRQPMPAPRHGEHKRIRLAYLSGDLREHAVAYSFAGLLERHDRQRFEVSAYSYGPDDGSAMRARLERAFDHFVDIRNVDNVEAARQIRQAEIDILVDIGGYTGNNRGGIAALRPAPIQINQQGFPATMGASFMDFIIADAEMIPPEFERFYREKVVRLSGCFLVSDDSQPLPGPPPARRSAGLPEQGVVFCSFNNSYKILPDVFDVWMRLLQRVEGSVLWLRHESDPATANLRREAERRGVPACRLIFASRIDLADHLARHRLADLFLDTFPYSAHSTGAHSLWAGVPVLTIRGETFVSRVAASLLRTAGLPELVVDSLEAYEAKALELARRPDRLQAMRRKLEAERATSPLFDTDRFRRQLEDTLVGLYERHVADTSRH
jgi:predicted O-linked N-acetylglucosamine transferase (SPINDLY family)